LKACQLGSLEVVKFLFEEAKADPSLVNVNDETCIIIAVRCKHLDLVRYLSHKVQHLIDYECSKNGLTALARAALDNQFELADILIKEGHA
jgi:ankyrin repeat protein